MTSKVVKWLSLGALFVMLILATFAYGFRTETLENPALGTIYRKYRYWKPSSLAIDSNHDGKINAISYLREGASDFGDSPREYFEDRDFDGRFEIYASYRDGVLFSVEVDRDGDGIPEEVYEGEEAAKAFFLESVPKE